MQRVLESNSTDLPITKWWVLVLPFFFTTNADSGTREQNKLRIMKFIAFAVVASLFSLAMADSCPDVWCLKKKHR